MTLTKYNTKYFEETPGTLNLEIATSYLHNTPTQLMNSFLRVLQSCMFWESEDWGKQERDGRREADTWPGHSVSHSLSHSLLHCHATSEPCHVASRRTLRCNVKLPSRINKKNYSAKAEPNSSFHCINFQILLFWIRPFQLKFWLLRHDYGVLCRYLHTLDF